MDLVHPVKSDQVHREGPQLLLGGSQCRRASAAAGSSQNSRRAPLTAAPGYARRWCTIKTLHFRMKYLTSPRREQPRRVLRGCDSPSCIPYQIFFCAPPKCVMRNKLNVNQKRRTVVLLETPVIFKKCSVSIVCSSRLESVMRNKLNVNQRRRSVVLLEVPVILKYCSLSIVCSSRHPVKRVGYWLVKERGVEWRREDEVDDTG